MSLFSGQVRLNIRMLRSKVTSKIRAPFDCRMRQNSPMTIYNVNKIQNEALVNTGDISPKIALVNID